MLFTVSSWWFSDMHIRCFLYYERSCANVKIQYLRSWDELETPNGLFWEKYCCMLFKKTCLNLKERHIVPLWLNYSGPREIPPLTKDFSILFCKIISAGLNIIAAHKVTTRKLQKRAVWFLKSFCISVQLIELERNINLSRTRENGFVNFKGLFVPDPPPRR